jgi:endonuclease/exonuclease/phosphatase family metal-dependent hydrolase
MSPGPRLRLLSYNVHGQRDDVGALAAVVRAADPDVVVVQEGPRRIRWRTRSATLANRFGLFVAGGGEPALGNLVLVGMRVRVHGHRCVQFPLRAGRHMRGAVLVECSVGRTRFVVAGSHLATDARERPLQAAILRRTLAEVEPPVLLGLDVNEEPDGPAWRTLTGSSGRLDLRSAQGSQTESSGLVDPDTGTGAATFPAAGPCRRIDAVLVDPRCEIVDYRVLDSPEARRASDHLPVLVEVSLPTG